jgi:hypothetical protein
MFRPQVGRADFIGIGSRIRHLGPSAQILLNPSGDPKSTAFGRVSSTLSPLIHALRDQPRGRVGIRTITGFSTAHIGRPPTWSPGFPGDSSPLGLAGTARLAKSIPQSCERRRDIVA